MPKIALLRGARQLLTLRGPAGPRRGADLANLGLIPSGAVLIVDGLIQQVGSSRRLESLALARDAEEIDASGCVVMPGFVDSHTHLVGAPPRMLDYELRLAGAGSEQIAAAGGGARAQAKAIQDLSPRTLESLALRVLEEAVKHGTTTLEAKSGFGLTESGEMKVLRVHRALRRKPATLISTLHCVGVAPEFENRQDEHVEWICNRLLPLVRRYKLAEIADIRCEAGGFTIEQVRRYLTVARQLGFALKMRLGVGAGSEAIRMAIELGALSVDHAIDVSEEDAWMLAASQTMVTLLPGVGFFREKERHARARLLIDSGAPVALASGYNPETSASPNMQLMLALACRCMHMTPAEAIASSTINAAHAMGRADKVGSLEPGKRADLLILRIGDYREISYHFGLNLMDRVIIGGDILVERSEVKWPVP